MSSAAEQFDLITDDPRLDDSGPSAIKEFRRFRELQREHGNLLTPSQAARILGVTNGQIGVWVSRKRFTSFVVMGSRMIPACEIIALYKERTEQGIRVGAGQGSKAPSLAEMARLMWKDLDHAEF